MSLKDRNFYEKYMQAFLKENAKVNLISKNDEKMLWEKHIFDSLSIDKFFDKYKNFKTLLDIGTGGGFPAVPIALTYPELDVSALDSTSKKINAIENLKKELDIKNLRTICNRAENLKEKFDIITSRAVASLETISHYALPLLNKDGYFIAYKSRLANEEIADAKTVLKRFDAKIIDIIDYELPLPENFVRKLIIISK